MFNAIQNRASSSGRLKTYTWAALFALPTSDLVVGQLAMVTDWNTPFVWTGTAWIPTAGRVVVFRSGVDVGQSAAPGNATENVLSGCQATIPAGLIKSGGGILRVRGMVEKSATTETADIRIYFGASAAPKAATDPIIGGQTATGGNLAFAAASRAVGFEFVHRINGITSLRKVGTGGASLPSGFAGASTTQRPGGLAGLPSMLVNPSFVTLTAQLSAGTAEFISCSLFEVSVEF